MQLIRMHFVPTRDLRNTRARRKTLFNKPQCTARAGLVGRLLLTCMLPML